MNAAVWVSVFPSHELETHSQRMLSTLEREDFCLLFQTPRSPTGALMQVGSNTLFGRIHVLCAGWRLCHICSF